jgi:hypothetical protein
MIEAVEDALEALFRTSFTDLPAGLDGVEREVRQPSELQASKLPHLMFADAQERSVLLRFRQQRVTATLTLYWLRRNTTHAQMLMDYEAIRFMMLLDETLGGAADIWHVSMGGLHEAPDDANRVLRITIDAVKVM